MKPSTRWTKWPWWTQKTSIEIENRFWLILAGLFLFLLIFTLAVLF